MPRTVILTLLAGGVACVVDFLIALVGFRFTHVPRDFPRLCRKVYKPYYILKGRGIKNTPAGR
jgi:hypothetical protein